MRLKEVEIPDDVSLEVKKEGEVYIITARGPKGEAQKRIKGKVEISINGKDVDVKGEKEMINTVRAHIANLVKGVKEGFVKKMKIRYSHFPMKVEVRGKEVIIKNFLGERKERKAKIVGNAKVSVKGQDVIIEGTNIEEVSQTAANIRQATKIRNKDFRVFQDGIYYALEG